MALVVLGLWLVDWIVMKYEGIRIANATCVRIVGHRYGDECCHGAHCQDNGCG